MTTTSTRAAVNEPAAHADHTAVPAAVPVPAPPPARYRRVRLALGWGVVGLLVGHAGFRGGIAIDLMYGLLALTDRLTGEAGLAIRPDWFGAGHRLAALALAGWLAVATLRYQRRTRGACPRCGRRPGASGTGGGWLVPAAAYLSAVPALSYAALKLHWGFGGTAGLRDPDAFAGFHPWSPGLGDTAVLAVIGVAVALAMAHGRPRLPRWLLLTPAVIGLLLLLPVATYGTVAAISTALAGGAAVADSVLAPWVAYGIYPAFLLWGVALAVVTVGYGYRTRRRCRRCGQG